MTSLLEFTLTNNLMQVVNFNTWSRVIKGMKKESCLDHVYVNNLASVINVSPCQPCFGDHTLVLIELCLKLPNEKIQITRRDWSSYCPKNYNNMLLDRIVSSNISWQSLTVNEHWNTLENLIISVIDKVAPLKSFDANSAGKNLTLPIHVKSKINKRNRLLKSRNVVQNMPIIKTLNKDIKANYI